MDIEDIFEKWDEDEDDLAVLLEDNETAVNTIEAEDSEDEDETESEDDGSTFKCSKCIHAETLTSNSFTTRTGHGLV